MLGEEKRMAFPRQGVIDLPSRQINDLKQKGNRMELELVTGDFVVFAALVASAAALPAGPPAYHAPAPHHDESPKPYAYE